ncbi:uncharacterized protein LOC119609643 [Lucilia sericata]|uniref:uncharacterized protein LOC119609643 n=1 Tax=Lucilia sericata TaxID=13632 RepID=UPI0018A8225A|nr:uncharacterized protein LOC119609643 [Lucilia sericata]
MTTRSPTRTNTHSQTNSITTNNNTNSFGNQSIDRIPQVDLVICASSVKLPQFWTNCPEAWFVHAEMQFATKGTTIDQTKYEYIITALPQDVIIKVLDIIQNPTTTDRYLNLKKGLIERHPLSETSKLDKILSNSDMAIILLAQILPRIC